MQLRSVVWVYEISSMKMKAKSKRQIISAPFASKSAKTPRAFEPHGNNHPLRPTIGMTAIAINDRVKGALDLGAALNPSQAVPGSRRSPRCSAHLRHKQRSRIAKNDSAASDVFQGCRGCDKVLWSVSERELSACMLHP